MNEMGIIFYLSARVPLVISRVVFRYGCLMYVPGCIRPGVHVLVISQLEEGLFENYCLISRFICYPEKNYIDNVSTHLNLTHVFLTYQSVEFSHSDR